ncbi:Carbonic anhydrase, beta class [Candidatus Syntrophocurvum alkaliphilum]|uniref:carbonic anhydrase n=1 Tax=Candidatus Syntrophocurvum alkaliphilum TaxID=2293317 RepID=A0A6I6DIK0_9FIRM|nr:carbonic anhydrase [Candidatus Syntrophocurvum alkaliphilum]QGU00519.1 Carbonic anhydrase, beta class [Candidatus Syntrophocurvum alkaliphilum]
MSNAGAKVDAKKVLDNLKDGILSFEKSFPLEEFKKGDFKHNPSVTLLNCADARMPANMFGQLFNNVFVIENIGNQVRTNEGSVLYGLLHLRTPLLVITGHTDCGAIKASQTNFVDLEFALRNELSIVKQSIEEGTSKSSFEFSSDAAVKATELAEFNVDSQVNYLMKNEAVANLINNNELLILGLMVDLHNIYDNGHGKIYTINANGENNADVLKTYANLGTFADQAKRLTKV